MFLSTGESPYFTRGDIPSYFTELFYDAYQVWSRYVKFGLPHGGGWKHEREIVVKIIEIFDAEKDTWTERKIKNGSRTVSRKS